MASVIDETGAYTGESLRLRRELWVEGVALGWAYETLYPEVQLGGTVYDWSAKNVDVDALVTPLGLSGSYTVFGIDGDERNLPPYPSVHRRR